MKKLITFLIVAILSISAFAQKDPFEGFYKGEVEGLKKLPWFISNKNIYAEVFREGDSYRIRLLHAIFSRADNFFIQDNLKAENGTISFSGVGEKFSITKGEISKDSISATGKCAKSNISFNLKRYKHKTTVGETPHKGAKVLFDGTNTDNFEHKDGSACNWDIENGALVVNTKKGSIYTKEAFEGAFFMHIEFMCPPDSYHLKGQKKNNSGIYIGDYELQILDSFGVESLWDDCGAIYRQSPPRVNACLEAGEWQSYDILFSPFESEGKLYQHPCITAHQNGVMIHYKTPILTATAGASADPSKYKHSKKPLKIMLQEHKNKVQFRNIWILPVEK